MVVLSDAQKQQFSRDGILLVENAVSGDQLQALRDQFNLWVDESRGHESAYGSILDGRPRFDLQPGHSADTPGLRRVNAPSEVSDAYYEVLRNSPPTSVSVPDPVFSPRHRAQNPYSAAGLSTSMARLRSASGA